MIPLPPPAFTFSSDDAPTTGAGGQGRSHLDTDNTHTTQARSTHRITTLLVTKGVTGILTPRQEAGRRITILRENLRCERSPSRNKLAWVRHTRENGRENLKFTPTPRTLREAGGGKRPRHPFGQHTGAYKRVRRERIRDGTARHGRQGRDGARVLGQETLLPLHH